MFKTEDTEEFLKDLKTIVEIESPTLNKKGIDKFYKFFINKVKKWQLPVECVFKYYNKDAGPILLITNLSSIVKGNTVNIETNNKELNFLMLAHADTVYSVGTYKKYKFNINENIAKAPGIIDDKAGALMGLYALKYLAINSFKFAFIINSNEEQGSSENSDLIKQLAKISKYCFTLEAAREDGSLVDKRLGSIGYKIKFTDTRADDSSFSIKNSCTLEMATFVKQVSLFNNVYKHNYVNCGFIKDDISENPKELIMRVKLRYLEKESQEKFEALLEDIKNNLIKKNDNIQLSYNLTSHYPELNVSDLTKELKAKMETIAKKSKNPLTWKTSMGGSDACFAYSVGCPTIDGMGPIGGNFHNAETEYLKIDSIAERCNFLIKTINEVTKME